NLGTRVAQAGLKNSSRPPASVFQLLVFFIFIWQIILSKLLGQKKTATHIKICTSCPNLKKKKCMCEAGEMAQQLRALVALPED
ncbi:hypothetical protein ACQP3C_29960, partial [Escherichia coli]